MKKIALIALVILALVSCQKSDTDMVVKPNTSFTIKVNQTAQLESDDLSITLLEITEDSRCPITVECVWAGRIVAEFRVKKAGEELIRSLTDNPSGESTISDQFEAFGHVVRLLEVLPAPQVEPIKQLDYILKVKVE